MYVGGSGFKIGVVDGGGVGKEDINHILIGFDVVAAAAGIVFFPLIGIGDILIEGENFCFAVEVLLIEFKLTFDHVLRTGAPVRGGVAEVSHVLAGADGETGKAGIKIIMERRGGESDGGVNVGIDGKLDVFGFNAGFDIRDKSVDRFITGKITVGGDIECGVAIPIRAGVGREEVGFFGDEIKIIAGLGVGAGEGLFGLNGDGEGGHISSLLYGCGFNFRLGCGVNISVDGGIEAIKQDAAVHDKGFELLGGAVIAVAELDVSFVPIGVHDFIDVAVGDGEVAGGIIVDSSGLGNCGIDGGSTFIQKGLRRGGLGLLCGFIRQGGGNGLFIQNGCGRRFDDAGFGFNEAEFTLDTEGKLRVGVGIVFADVLDDGIVIEIVQNRIEYFAVGSGGFDNLDGGEIRSIGVGLAVVDALLFLDKAVIAFHFGVDLVEDIAAGGVKLRGVADDFIHGLVDFITPGDGGRYRFGGYSNRDI